MAAAPATRAKPATRSERNARAIQRSRAGARSVPARPAPSAPRRRSGSAPARAPRQAPPVSVARIAHGGAAALLDRVLRGRGWVGLVATLLTGIVFLNVSLLELNRGIARTDAHATTLERTNSVLRSRLATLDSAERIQRLASARGFVLPQPGDVTYLRAGTGTAAANARLAAARIKPPSSGLASATTSTAAPTATATTVGTAAAQPTTATPVTATQTQTAVPTAPTTASTPAAGAVTAHP